MTSENQPILPVQRNSLFTQQASRASLMGGGAGGSSQPCAAELGK